jgi:hypothetical protein
MVFKKITFLLSVTAAATNGIRLEDIRVLTLKSGEYTVKGGRTDPILQLECVGSTCREDLLPRAMICKNTQPGWECTGDLDPDYKFVSTDVICEGLSHPNDPQVLEGSCGVEYKIVKKSSALFDFLSFVFSVFLTAMLFAGFCAQDFGFGTGASLGYLAGSARPSGSGFGSGFGSSRRR